MGEQLHKVPFLKVYLPETIKIAGMQVWIGEEMDFSFNRACIAEGFALFFFVIVACGTAVSNLGLPNPDPMVIAAAFGFSILCLAQIMGPLSGAHVNCAVSFALFTAGRISLARLVGYTLCQMFGSVMGALFLYSIFGKSHFGSNGWDESEFTGGQVFLGEVFGTMLLVLSVFITIDAPAAPKGGQLGAFPIAMSVMVAILTLFRIDGGSINPTRSFGPSVVAQWSGYEGTYAHQQYMFWFAPLFGAFLMATIYEYSSLVKGASLKDNYLNVEDDMELTVSESQVIDAGDTVTI